MKSQANLSMKAEWDYVSVVTNGDPNIHFVILEDSKRMQNIKELKIEYGPLESGIFGNWKFTEKD